MDVDTDADNVHMQPDTEQTDQMLLEVSHTLGEASAEDLEELLKLYKNFGSVSYKDAVSEVYSPPRVSALAGRMGLQRGFALDLTVVDPDDGKPWDFDCPAKRAKALRKVQMEKPTLLIGSPMCTPFSILQKLSREKRDPVEFKRMLHHGITHLKFCILLYWEQINNGRYFLREHPWMATSWEVREMQNLSNFQATTWFEVICVHMACHLKMNKVKA